MWLDFLSDPRRLIFGDLAAAKYPGHQWHDLSAKQQAGMIREHLLISACLINPHSIYMKYWDLVICVALIYVAVVTPYEVVFSYDLIIHLFIIDRIIDFLFVKDMVMQFFLKVDVQKSGTTGAVQLKTLKDIQVRYLRKWFIIDFVSILPFDLLYLLGFPGLRSLKMMRCLRILRLVKLFRILRSSRIITRWQNYFAISFSTQKLIKFILLTLVCSHWMACLWGFVGLSLARDLCDKDGSPIDLSNDVIADDERSWVTALFVGGKQTPDHPCVHFYVYIAALHWSVMTITSIGYGDIVPLRLEEYAVGVFCMLSGGVLWAYIIAIVCGIISHTHPVEENFQQNTDLLNSVMRDVAVPRSKRPLYREYLREAQVHDTMLQFQDVAQIFSPLLRGELMLCIVREGVEKVYYFKNAPLPFLGDVAENLNPRFFARREPVYGIRYCLCFSEKGTLAHGGAILVAGSIFQKDFIIIKRALQACKPTVALTYAHVLVLDPDIFNDILRKHPGFELQIRRYALKIAVARAVILCAEHGRVEQQTGGSIPLRDAFNRLNLDREGNDFIERVSSLGFEPPAHERPVDAMHERMDSTLAKLQTGLDEMREMRARLGVHQL